MKKFLNVAIVVACVFSAQQYLDGAWWAFAGLCASCVLLHLVYGKLQGLFQRDKVRSAENVSFIDGGKGARDLFLETLTAIGCQYEIGEGEDDRIHFAYQGEHFLVAADNERPYIIIFDYVWAQVELFDIDEVARLRKAINETNWCRSVQTMFTIDTVGKTMDVHCKKTILFIPQIPDIENYLRIELNEFFRAHQALGNEMARLRAEEGTNKN